MILWHIYRFLYIVLCIFNRFSLLFCLTGREEYQKYMALKGHSGSPKTRSTAVPLPSSMIRKGNAPSEHSLASRKLANIYGLGTY